MLDFPGSQKRFLRRARNRTHRPNLLDMLYRPSRQRLMARVNSLTRRQGSYFRPQISTGQLWRTLPTFCFQIALLEACLSLGALTWIFHWTLASHRTRTHVISRGPVYDNHGSQGFHLREMSEVQQYSIASIRALY